MMITYFCIHTVSTIGQIFILFVYSNIHRITNVYDYFTDSKSDQLTTTHRSADILEIVHESPQ